MAQIVSFSSSVKEIDDFHLTLPAKGQKVVPTELFHVRQGNRNVVIARTKDGTLYLFGETGTYRGSAQRACLTMGKHTLKEYIAPLVKAGLISKAAMDEAAKRVEAHDLREARRDRAKMLVAGAANGLITFTKAQQKRIDAALNREGP